MSDEEREVVVTMKERLNPYNAWDMMPKTMLRKSGIDPQSSVTVWTDYDGSVHIRGRALAEDEEASP